MDVVTIDEMEAMLEEAAASLPPEIFRELNGGIVLLPDVKYNEKGTDKDLFILGEYHRGGTMGRYISIYYGSLIRVFGHLGREAVRHQLLLTLKHEFVHHLESMAGERDLEKKDAEFLEDYFRNK